MLVTKYCRPQDREFMLSGSFKIGTHRGYSAGEGTGLLSDTSEGMGATEVSGDLVNWSGMIGTNTFINCSSIGNKGKSFVIQESINANIFCASGGDYNARRHSLLLAGEDGYAANPDLTAFIVFDAPLFKQALQLLSDTLFGGEHQWVDRPVTYGLRVREIPSGLFIGIPPTAMARRLIEQAFLKPPQFALEQEHRFVLLPKPPNLSPMDRYTREMPSHVKEAFCRSIYDAGSATPRF